MWQRCEYSRISYRCSQVFVPRRTSRAGWVWETSPLLLSSNLAASSWFEGAFGSSFTAQIFHRLVRHGKTGRVRLAWLHYGYYLKKQHSVYFSYLLTDFYRVMYNMPYLLQTRTVSTRQYTFPVTASWNKRMRFGFRFFSRELSNQRIADLMTRFGAFWTMLLFSYRDSPIEEYFDNLLETGIENRAYLHYRWL